MVMQAIAQHWQDVGIATVLKGVGSDRQIRFLMLGMSVSLMPNIYGIHRMFLGRASLWILALQHPQAKSAHPLHVRSWEKHGADEDLEETLKNFAAFCGVCHLELAEGIRAMSPAVKKRYEDSPSKSWLQAWEEEADHWIFTHPGVPIGAVNEALYFVRGFLVGTGSLESRFFKGRQPNHAKRMTEASMNHRMRIHMNGPDVEDFCSRKLHGLETTYRASALCRRSQALYRKYFGSKTLRGRERQCKRQVKDGDEAAISQYKNKGKKTGLKIGHMAHHLSEKLKQTISTKTKKVSDMDKLVHQRLCETTAGLTQVQEEKRQTALANQSAKRQFLEGMLQPVVPTQMKERHDKEVKKHNAYRLNHRASLISLAHNMANKKWVAADDCKVYLPHVLKQEWWKDDEGTLLSKDLTVVMKSVKGFCRKAPEKQKLWKVSTVEPFENGSWQADIVKKGLLMEDVGLLGAVLFGGYLVDRKWVEKSKSLLKKELLLEPLWKLVGSAMKKHLEVFFTRNLWASETNPEGTISRTMKAVLEAKPDRVWTLEVRKADNPSIIHQPEETSCWVWRDYREEIRTKDAWVVCGGADSGEKEAKDLVEKKEAKEKERAKLSEEIELLCASLETETGNKFLRSQGRLVKKKAQLKDLEAKLKMLKGQPVGLKKFLEEVVLPRCVLCPP